MKVFEGFSHIDFTYSSHHAMTSEIIQILREGLKKDLKNNKKMIENKRKPKKRRMLRVEDAEEGGHFMTTMTPLHLDEDTEIF